MRETPLTHKGIDMSKVKGYKKDIPWKYQSKKEEMAILILDKVDLKDNK